MPLGRYAGRRMMFTKGFAHENKPDLGRDGADGRNGVGDVRGVGEAEWEHPPLENINRSSPI